MNEYIMAFLCSSIGRYFIYQNSDTTGAGDIMLNIQSLIKFPIPLSSIYRTQIENLVSEQIKQYSHTRQRTLDKLIYIIYGFNDTELKEIENREH